MQVILEEQTPGGLTKIPLEIHGISETGFLTAADKHGEAYELHPDGNRSAFQVCRGTVLQHSSVDITTPTNSLAFHTLFKSLNVDAFAVWISLLGLSVTK